MNHSDQSPERRLKASIYESAVRQLKAFNALAYRPEPTWELSDSDRAFLKSLRIGRE